MPSEPQSFEEWLTKQERGFLKPKIGDRGLIPLLRKAFAAGQRAAEQRTYECDWGDCDEPAVAVRFDADGHGWLPVCKDHAERAASADTERLRNAVGIYFEALDAKPGVYQMSDPEMQEWLREIAIHQRAVRAILDAARTAESGEE